MQLIIPEGYVEVTKGKIRDGDEVFSRNVHCFLFATDEHIGKNVADAGGLVIRKAATEGDER